MLICEVQEFVYVFEDLDTVELGLAGFWGNFKGFGWRGALLWWLFDWGGGGHFRGVGGKE